MLNVPIVIAIAIASLSSARMSQVGLPPPTRSFAFFAREAYRTASRTRSLNASDSCASRFFVASTVSFRSWSFAVSSSTLLRFKSTSVFSRVPPRSSKSAPHTPTRAAPSRMKISIEREIASTKLMNELSLALPKYVALSGILSAAELAALAPRKTRTSPSSNHASLGVTSRIVVALFVFVVASYAMGASML